MTKTLDSAPWSDAHAHSWGMRVFVASDVVTFAALAIAVWLARRGGPPVEPAPALGWGLAMTLCLAGVSGSLILVTRIGRQRAGLAVAAVLALAFLVLAALEVRALADAGLHVRASLAAASLVTLTVYHAAHVAVGWGLLLAALVRPRPLAPLSLYWHTVDAIWLVLLLSFYS